MKLWIGMIFDGEQIEARYWGTDFDEVMSAIRCDKPDAVENFFSDDFAMRVSQWLARCGLISRDINKLTTGIVNNLEASIIEKLGLK